MSRAATVSVSVSDDPPFEGRTTYDAEYLRIERAKGRWVSFTFEDREQAKRFASAARYHERFEVRSRGARVSARLLGAE